MIDLHSHILPGIDDGAADMEAALAMARMAAADGVEVMACTPHAVPGIYDPAAADIVARVAALNQRLAQEGIDLAAVAGCEIHVRPDMLALLQAGELLAIHTSRHVLCEAPYEALPPHLDGMFAGLIAAGYRPILAHAERYRWADRALPWIRRMAESGVLIQVTAASLTGQFGPRALDLSLRLLEEGLIGLVASDAHDTERRPPGLSRARDLVARARGAAEARAIFLDRPAAILLGQPLPATRLMEAS